MALLRHYFVELQSPTNIHIILLHTKFLIDQFLFRCTVRFLWMRHLGSYVAHDIFSIIDWLFYNKQTQCKMQGAEWIGYVTHIYISFGWFFFWEFTKFCEVLWNSSRIWSSFKYHYEFWWCQIFRRCHKTISSIPLAIRISSFFRLYLIVPITSPLYW